MASCSSHRGRGCHAPDGTTLAGKGPAGPRGSALEGPAPCARGQSRAHPGRARPASTAGDDHAGARCRAHSDLAHPCGVPCRWPGAGTVRRAAPGATAPIRYGRRSPDHGAGLFDAASWAQALDGARVGTGRAPGAGSAGHWSRDDPSPAKKTASNPGNA